MRETSSIPHVILLQSPMVHHQHGIAAPRFRMASMIHQAGNELLPQSGESIPTARCSLIWAV
jgi:hypothetical protein